MHSGKEIYEFGPFRLEVKERRLLCNSEPVQLRAKVFDTLRVLVENHGRLVTKTELMKAVWPDAIVEEGNLAHNLTVLRKALGDRESGRPHVETIPGQGYRFIAAVWPVEENAATQQPAGSWEVFAKPTPVRSNSHFGDKLDKASGTWGVARPWSFVLVNVWLLVFTWRTAH